MRISPHFVQDSCASVEHPRGLDAAKSYWVKKSHVTYPTTVKVLTVFPFPRVDSKLCIRREKLTWRSLMPRLLACVKVAYISHYSLFEKKMCHDLSECARNLSSNDTNSTKLPVHPLGFKRK